MLNIKNLAIIYLLTMSQVSFATLYLFEDSNANNGGISDRLDSITSSYDNVTQNFTWNVNFNSDPTDVDGFWLVVNNGPNPKSSDVNELAIMYGDMATGTLSTFIYNGLNSANSYLNPAIHLQTDAFNVTSDSLSLNIDTSIINTWSNDPDYNGIAFTEDIGIWFHISTGSNFSYDNGILSGYSYSSQGWYDSSWKKASVPEPATLTLIGLGLLGMGLRRQKNCNK